MFAVADNNNNNNNNNIASYVQPAQVHDGKQNTFSLMHLVCIVKF